MLYTKKKGLGIMNCRGQSYDIASNICRISNIQIKTINSLADHFPCSAHSSNLLGSFTAESVSEVVDFFANL